jgi:hypothetical protein
MFWNQMNTLFDPAEIPMNANAQNSAQKMIAT